MKNKKVFFAVSPKGFTVDKMHVLLLGDTRQMAIMLYEHWNNGKKWNRPNEYIHNVIVKIEAKNERKPNETKHI